MSAGEEKPRAREGLLTANHAKRSRRFVTLIDPATRRVTLLERWEHAVFLLCNGARDARVIARMLQPSVEGQPIDERAVERALAFLAREGVVERVAEKKLGLASLPPASITLDMRLAFHEWYSDGLMGYSSTAPFLQPEGSYRVGLEPTIALPNAEGEDPSNFPLNVGSTLILAEAESLLGSRAEPADGDEPPSEEPATMIGSLAPGVQTGGSVARENEAEWRGALVGSRIGVERGVLDDEPDGSTRDSPFSDEGVSPNIEDLLNAVDHDFKAVETREAEKRSVPHGNALPGTLNAASESSAASERKRAVVKLATGVEPDAVLVKAAEEAEARAQAKLQSPPKKGGGLQPEGVLRPTLVGPPPDAASMPEPQVQAPLRVSPPRVGRDGGPRPAEGPTEAVVPVFRAERGSAARLDRDRPARGGEQMDRPDRVNRSDRADRTERVDRPGRVEVGRNDTDPEVDPGALAARERDVVGTDPAHAALSDELPTSTTISLGEKGKSSHASPSEGREEATARVALGPPPLRPTKTPRVEAPEDAASTSQMVTDMIFREPIARVDDPAEVARARRRPKRGEPGSASLPPPLQRKKVTPVVVEATPAEAQASASLVASPRAREIFDSLRRAGLRARGVEAAETPDRASPDRQARRRDATNARLFDDALNRLSRGDIDVALKHFRRLKEKMPDSTRLGAFLRAIEAVSLARPARKDASKALDDFEGALEEAISYGRCPACFSMLEERSFARCFACGFALT